MANVWICILETGRHSPKEANYRECSENMKRLCNARADRDKDSQLEKIYEDQIRKELYKISPATFFFANKQDITELAEAIARKAETYVLSVLPYEDLLQVLEEQPSAVCRVGAVAKNQPFAIIDDAARVVGCYFPKSTRQKIVEGKIKVALDTLEWHLKGKGRKPNPKVRAYLEDYLMRQHYPKWVPDIKVISLKVALTGDGINDAYLPNGKVMQMRYDAKKATLYYHIK